MTTPTPSDGDRQFPGDGALDARDMTVMAALARLYDDVDPVPHDLVERSMFTVAWAEVEDELAHLVDASDARAPAGVRGNAGQARSMTFASDDATLTVMVTAMGRERRRLDGWIESPATVTARVRLVGEVREAAVSQDGRFELTDLPAGMVQVMLVDAGDGHTVLMTPAMSL